MDESFPLILIVLIVIGFLVVAVCNYMAAQRRREALFLLANTLGLQFYQIDPFNITANYGFFDLFSRGHRRRAENVVAGRLGSFDVIAFDFIYYVTQSTGKGSREQKYTVSAVIVDTMASFRPLAIRPEGLWDKFKGSVGFDDIDFESAEFSRKFYVASQDRKFAYDVIHQRMMEFLLQNPPWNMQLMGRSVLVHSGRALRSEEFRPAMDFVYEFLRLFPDYLAQQIGLQR